MHQFFYTSNFNFVGITFTLLLQQHIFFGCLKNILFLFWKSHTMH